MSHREAKSYSFKALSNIAKYQIVKLGPNKGECDLAGAGEGFGVAMNDATTGGFCEVAMIGGGAKVSCGATVAIGDEIKSDATSRAVAAVSTDKFIGIALEAGTVGQTISVERTYGYKA